MRDAFPPPIVVVEIVYVFRLCGIVCRWLMSFGWIVRKRLFCLCGMCGKILRSVVGAVPVCPPASLQGRIRRSSLAHNACVFIMETPLRERSGGHAGAAPTCFVWVGNDVR